MKSSNPYAACVVAEIDIDQLIKAVEAIEHFAANYPEERQSTYISSRLMRAAALIESKALKAVYASSFHHDWLPSHWPEQRASADRTPITVVPEGQPDVRKPKEYFGNNVPIAKRTMWCSDCLTWVNHDPTTHQPKCPFLKKKIWSDCVSGKLVGSIVEVERR